MCGMKTTLSREKPWAILGLSRKRYMAARPWKRFASRAQFEEILLAIHAEKPELVQDLKTHGQAEALLKAMGMKAT